MWDCAAGKGTSCVTTIFVSGIFCLELEDQKRLCIVGGKEADDCCPGDKVHGH